MSNLPTTPVSSEFRYRIKASTGGRVRIKFAESCSTELDDDSLSPDDNDERKELLVAEKSQPHRSNVNINNCNQRDLYELSYDNDNIFVGNIDDEKCHLMIDNENLNESQINRNGGGNGRYNGENFRAQTSSILLPSTTIATTSSALSATNRGADFNDDFDTNEIVYTNNGSGGTPVRMRTDLPYAVRSGDTTGGNLLQFTSPSPSKGHPRMGRRFTLNPLIFAKEERDARRQSLAQLKLSYYPSNANPDVYDAGLGICSWSLMCLSWLFFFLTFPISVCFCIKVVQEYERAVIFRLGRLIGGGARGPGIFFVMPCIESYTKVDLRTVSFSVPPQEILTRDSVTVSVDAVVYYRVCNATVSVANVENAHHSTRLLAQTTLRNMLGTRNLSDILSDRDNIANAMQTLLDDATESWGIKVERVEIKDVRLPIQLQRAMAAEAEATREARAKIIAAEGEQKASRSLHEAATVIAMSPAAIQLRYLQTLNSVAAEKNSTIIFPLPIELVRHFIGNSNSA